MHEMHDGTRDLHLADSLTMEGPKSRDRLMAYPKADTSACADGAMDPDGFWFSTKLITTGIDVNTSAAMVPC